MDGQAPPPPRQEVLRPLAPAAHICLEYFEKMEPEENFLNIPAYFQTISRDKIATRWARAKPIFYLFFISSSAGRGGEAAAGADDAEVINRITHARNLAVPRRQANKRISTMRWPKENRVRIIGFRWLGFWRSVRDADG